MLRSVLARCSLIATAALTLVAAGCARPASAPVRATPIAGTTAPLGADAALVGAATPRFVVRGPDASLVFADAVTDTDDGPPVPRPVILRGGGRRFAALDPIAADLDGFGWALVSASDDGRTVVAVADGAVEGPGPTLAVLVSVDGGTRWDRADLAKPYYLGAATAVRLAGDGHGELTVDVGDYGQGGVGVYTYRTADFGRSWSAPSFRPSTVAPAEATTDEPLAAVLDRL